MLESGYKGLLILPDEFELFKNNPDTAQNYQQLKGFIFDVQEEKNLPIGCVVLTYNETIADIRLREHILHRFSEPEGSHINLEQFYGRTPFAKNLWEKLVISCALSDPESKAIDDDVLEALGQFLRHQRSTKLISGPRSVIATFRRAALHYTEKKRSYSLHEFSEDYLSGHISFSSQETETVRAYTEIMGLPFINDATSRDLVKLLCVHPEGVPPGIFQKHEILNPEAIVDKLLPEHVVTPTIGPTLKHYASDGGVPPLTEILRRLKTRFRPEDREFHRNAVQAFEKHVLPTIFTPRKQDRIGWTLVKAIDGNWDGHLRRDWAGTVLREYPDRTLTIDIGTEAELPSSSLSQFHVQFILNPDLNATNSCQIKPNGIVFEFNIRNPIDSQEIPKDISYLSNLFRPSSISPLLLLSILYFFDTESIISVVERETLKRGVDSLKAQILNELIGYFFSHEVKTGAIIESLEPEEDFAPVPAGKNFVEGILRILIPKQFPDYHAVATTKGWTNNLGKYRDALNKGHSLGVRQGSNPMKGNSKLFNMGQVAFDNFCAGVARDLLKVEQIPDRRDEQDIYFVRHPFEELLVEQLQNSLEKITIDERTASSVKLNAIYQQAGKLGYLDQEIEELINILKVRGMVDRKTEAGIEYLCLVETFINFAELEAKLKGLEENAKLAESNGFEYQCDHLSSARTLAGFLGIEHNEVWKDDLRQNLNSAEDHFKNKCAEWVQTEHGSLNKKIHELETLHLQVPKILDQQTGHPVTAFSQILFQSVQPLVKSFYTKISNEIRNIQEKIGETCNREIGTYESNGTPQNAIETATRLRQTRSRVDTDINRLNQQGTNAQELNRLFEHWRALAHQIEGDIQLIDNSIADPAVQNLIERLGTVQRDIRQHLADNRNDLKDVLSSHEHFKTQVEAIKTEFDQLLRGKTDAFIAYQNQIEQQLRDLPGPSLQRVDFNPVDSDGCYRKVRENAVDKLRAVVDDAQTEGNQRQRELLKPIKVFEVPDSLRTKAIQLSEALEQLANELQEIGREFTVEAVNPQKLSDWVEQLVSKLEKGKAIAERRKRVERELDEIVPDPSPTAQRLLDELTPQQGIDFTELIVGLLDNETFNSTQETLKSLRELYQANIINLTVHRK